MLLSFSLVRAPWPVLLLLAGSFSVASVAPVADSCEVDGQHGQQVTGTGYRPTLESGMGKIKFSMSGTAPGDLISQGHMSLSVTSNLPLGSGDSR
ncbi:MAG: hypothetical protein ACJ73N_05125 [Bryobacteraceae bacterium]